MRFFVQVSVFWVFLFHSHCWFLTLQNDQKDYFVCGVKLPNSEDFQGSCMLLIQLLQLTLLLSFMELSKLIGMT